MLFILFLSCAGSEKNIGITNNPPEATITSHSDGDQIFELSRTLFFGTVSDDDDPTEDLLVTWYADLEILCEEIPAPVDGSALCEAEVPAGVERITLSVRDPFDARTDASITIEVVESEAPEVQILAPTDGSTHYANQLITFEGLVSDAEDPADSLSAYWTSSLDGDLSSVDATPNSNGETVGYGNLTEGQHIIELHVEDSSGKTNKDSLVITVAGANTAPSCEITAPLTNSAGAEGQLVTFLGQVDDPDMPNNELAVSWNSDKDGDIGTATPNGAGVVTFPYDGLSLNTHVITMTATDDAGEACVADILYTVGSPPNIVLTAPTQGSQYNSGDSIGFVAEVSDSEDAPDTLSIDWVSSIDGSFSTTSAASNGIAQFNTSSLSSGAHDITVTVTDSTGLYAEALTQLTINGLPSQPTLSLSPNPAFTSDALVANASGSVDPEGSPITYTYDWLRNGASTGLTGSTLASSETTKGDTWTVRATPSDGIGTGPFAEASITISNQIPEVSSVSISPSNPSPQSTLTCTATGTDADGDTVTLSYAWTLGGNLLSSTTDTLQGPFQQGETITCTVTPFDGMDTGLALSDSVTISNSPPSITTLSLSPSQVYTDDIIQAAATGSDPDGDPLIYTWDWYVDAGSGYSVVQSLTGPNIDSLDGLNHFDRDDEVYVALTLSDGSSSVSQSSSPITILNTPPSAFNVLISPSAPVAGLDDLVCTAQDNDADGDAVSLSYSWTVDGASTTYTTDTIPLTDIADAEVWVCTVTPNDGTIDGSSSSATVTVGADVEGATGVGFCASAGMGTDPSGHQFITCLSESGVAGESSTDPAANTHQPGSIVVFSPE